MIECNDLIYSNDVMHIITEEGNAKYEYNTLQHHWLINSKHDSDILFDIDYPDNTTYIKISELIPYNDHKMYSKLKLVYLININERQLPNIKLSKYQNQLCVRYYDHEMNQIFINDDHDKLSARFLVS